MNVEQAASINQREDEQPDTQGGGEHERGRSMFTRGSGGKDEGQTVGALRNICLAMLLSGGLSQKFSLIRQDEGKGASKHTTDISPCVTHCKMYVKYKTV